MPSLRSILKDRLQTLRESAAASRAYDESVMEYLRGMVAKILAREYRRRAEGEVSEAEALSWATRVVEASHFTYAMTSTFLEQHLSEGLDEFWQKVDFPS